MPRSQFDTVKLSDARVHVGGPITLDPQETAPAGMRVVWIVKQGTLSVAGGVAAASGDRWGDAEIDPRSNWVAGPVQAFATLMVDGDQLTARDGSVSHPGAFVWTQQIDLVVDS
jgi:hypothetical protein